MSFLYKHIAVTHATSLHLNANVAATRFWYISFYCFECGAGTTNLHCGHLVHKHASTGIALILVEMSGTRIPLCAGFSYPVNPSTVSPSPPHFLFYVLHLRAGEAVLEAVEFISIFCTTLFTGAAIYVNLAEHPARMACGTQLAATEWIPSYKRAARMQ